MNLFAIVAGFASNFQQVSNKNIRPSRTSKNIKNQNRIMQTASDDQNDSGGILRIQYGLWCRRNMRDCLRQLNPLLLGHSAET